MLLDERRARAAAERAVGTWPTADGSSTYAVSRCPAVAAGVWWLFGLTKADHPELLVPGAGPVYVSSVDGKVLDFGEHPDQG